MIGRLFALIFILLAFVFAGPLGTVLLVLFGLAHVFDWGGGEPDPKQKAIDDWISGKRRL